MTERVTIPSEIPGARFYVLATDSFMSGWGHAEGRPNVLIVPCDTLVIAEAVFAILKGRDEMRRVRITGAKPRSLGRWFAQVKPADVVLTWITSADSARERAEMDR